MFELAELGGFSHGNEAVAGFDVLVGRGVEAHGFAAFDGEDDYAALLADARRFKRLTRERRIPSDVDFADLEVHTKVSCCRIEERDDVRAQERLRDALSGKRVGRDDGIRACGQEMFFSGVFAGAGDDLKMRIETACGKDDVEIRGVGGGGGDQAPGMARSAHLSQCLLERGISCDDQPVL